MKFEEKFVKRPQQIKAKIEREKNILKKIDNVNLPVKIRALILQIIFFSVKVLIPASLKKCLEMFSSDIQDLRMFFYFISAMFVWLLRISPSFNMRTSLRQEQLWQH